MIFTNKRSGIIVFYNRKRILNSKEQSARTLRCTRYHKFRIGNSRRLAACIDGYGCVENFLYRFALICFEKAFDIVNPDILICPAVGYRRIIACNFVYGDDHTVLNPDGHPYAVVAAGNPGVFVFVFAYELVGAGYVVIGDGKQTCVDAEHV